MNTQQKPFDNPKVREAINYAINKEALVKVAFSGYAIPAEGVLPKGVEYAAKLGPWPYNPAKARELLKEAGYPNGFESTLWSAYNYTTAQKVIQFVQQQLAQVGIKVQVQALEAGQRVERVESAQDPATAPVRMYYVGWSSSTGEADWAMRPLLASESFPPKLFNTAYYKNAEVDADIAKALVTTDQRREGQALRRRAAAHLEGRALGLPGHRAAAVGARAQPGGLLRDPGRQLQLRRSRAEVDRCTAGEDTDDSATLLKRLLGLLPTLLIVAVLVFLFVHMLPGDPARLAAGPDAGPETVALVRARPRPRQAAAAAVRALLQPTCCRATSASSMRTKRPVSTEIAERFMPTLLLTLTSMAWSVVFGMVIGIVSAVWRNRGPTGSA